MNYEDYVDHYADEINAIFQVLKKVLYISSDRTKLPDIKSVQQYLIKELTEIVDAVESDIKENV